MQIIGRADFGGRPMSVTWMLFVDDEDDERCYNFQMAILAADLE